VLAVLAAGAVLNCWAAASYRYHLPIELLYAIGQQESSIRSDAVSVNPDGSIDLGLMQINSRWLPVLQGYGISRDDLLQKPCANIQVGAWILSQAVERAGYNWQAIGAYNAGPINANMSKAQRQRKIAKYRRYSELVIGRWKRLKAQASAQGPAPSPRPPAPAAHIAVSEHVHADR
jgi:soluble lytic murein transglycosylase-like protein